MTFFITALTNDTARLIAGETRTTDRHIADLVAATYEKQGYIVIRRTDG